MSEQQDALQAAAMLGYRVRPELNHSKMQRNDLDGRVQQASWLRHTGAGIRRCDWEEPHYEGFIDVKRLPTESKNS